MTNKEAHEIAAGIPLEPLFFIINEIDPDEICDMNVDDNPSHITTQNSN